VSRFLLKGKHLPQLADRVLAWEKELGHDAMEKMLWDQPVRFFGVP
jgi:hypothetical protein